MAINSTLVRECFTIRWLKVVELNTPKSWYNWIIIKIPIDTTEKAAAVCNSQRGRVIATSPASAGFKRGKKRKIKL
jgi:hypothetical protein